MSTSETSERRERHDVVATPTGRNRRGAGTTLVVASVVIALAAGVAALRQSRQVHDLRERLGERSLEQAAAVADQDPKNRHVTFVSSSGDRRVDAVIGDSGQAFVLEPHFDSLPVGKVYQLWAGGGGEAPFVSLGLFPKKAAAVAFTVPTDARSLFVTVEPSRGSVGPTGKKVMEAQIG